MKTSARALTIVTLTFALWIWRNPPLTNTGPPLCVGLWCKTATYADQSDCASELAVRSMQNETAACMPEDEIPPPTSWMRGTKVGK